MCRASFRAGVIRKQFGKGFVDILQGIVKEPGWATALRLPLPVRPGRTSFTIEPLFSMQSSLCQATFIACICQAKTSRCWGLSRLCEKLDFDPAFHCRRGHRPRLQFGYKQAKTSKYLGLSPAMHRNIIPPQFQLSGPEGAVALKPPPHQIFDSAVQNGPQARA